MPKLRSIAVSVISHWELNQFPEFPHPDSSQFRYGSSKPAEDGGSESRKSSSTWESMTSNSRADSALERSPSISCYIPSVPGVRFSVKYNIQPPYPEGQLFYFKLSMNGRQIASWGADPSKRPRGQVIHALFEAAGGCPAEDGRSMLNDGCIEARPFIFASEVVGSLAADDGGLIEVRVFRARGKKRKAPGLDRCRSQDQYGINLPNAGLLDKPQDVRFYDWFLVDPKDEPYAAFRFHYRSWKHLEALQLIPPSHPKSLLKPSNSFAFLAELANSENVHSEDEMEAIDSHFREDSSLVCEDSNPWTASSPTSCRFNGFDQIDEPVYMRGPEEASASSYSSLEQKHDPSGTATSAFKVSQAVLDEWEDERPLPKLPKAKSSFEHSRKSSTSSNAPSIAPSLLSWIDRGSENPSPEAIIEFAAAVPVLLSSPTKVDTVALECRSSSRANCYKQTSSKPLGSRMLLVNPLIPPPEAIFPPLDESIHNPRPKGPHTLSFRRRVIITDRDNGDDDHNRQNDQGDIISCLPSEGEWLSSQAKPSFVKKGLDKIVAATRSRELRRRQAQVQQKDQDRIMNENFSTRTDLVNDLIENSSLHDNSRATRQEFFELGDDGAGSGMNNWI